MGRGGNEPFPLVTRQKTEITLVRVDAWAGIYVDGELHSEEREDKINLDSVIKEFGFARSEMNVAEVYADESWWAEEANERLPEDLDDVVIDEEA
jgi:hypothetical protein